MPEVRIQEGSTRADGHYLRTFWRGLTTRRRVSMRWRLTDVGPLEKAMSLKLWGLSAVTARMHRVRRQLGGVTIGSQWSRLWRGLAEIPNLTHEDSFRFVGVIRPPIGNGPVTFAVSAYTYMAGLGAVAPFETRANLPWPIQKPLCTVPKGSTVQMDLEIWPSSIRYRAYQVGVFTSDEAPWYDLPAVTPPSLLYSKAWLYAGGGRQQPAAPTNARFLVVDD